MPKHDEDTDEYDDCSEYPCENCGKPAIYAYAVEVRRYRIDPATGAFGPSEATYCGTYMFDDETRYFCEECEELFDNGKL